MYGTTLVVVDTDVVSFLFKNHLWLRRITRSW